MSKKQGQQNVRLTPAQQAFLDAVEKNHRMTGPEVIRGLLDAAADFYAQHGWFSFPLTITPKMFQHTAHVEAAHAEERQALVAALPKRRAS